MKVISVEELKQKVSSKKDLHIIDVRELPEYNEDNIGALHLPLSQISQYQIDEIEDWDMDDEIFLHCRSGQRSAQACLILECMGYRNVFNVDGGIVAWRERFGSECL